jgi:glucokinase
MPVLAIDLGGTKLATAVVDQSGKILSLRREPVRKSSFADTVQQIAAEAHAAVRASGLAWNEITRAGVIVPGVAYPSGFAWAPNLWGDADVLLSRELRDHVPAPLVVESDRAGYVLGEHWLGVSQGLSDMVFVAIGTGIGAGILSDGRLIRGCGGMAGAVGWIALTPQYEDLYRAVGCWEALSAGPAVARRAGHQSAQSVVSAALQGDAGCRLALDEAARYIGMGVANLISIFNPQMVVLGGGVMEAGELLLDPIRREASKWALPRAAADARIELSKLGDRAGLLGAARLALGS